MTFVRLELARTAESPGLRGGIEVTEESWTQFPEVSRTPRVLLRLESRFPVSPVPETPSKGGREVEIRPLGSGPGVMSRTWLDWGSGLRVPLPGEKRNPKGHGGGRHLLLPGP